MLKEGSTITKLRDVFDASAKTTTGFSPNDCLLVGPKRQDDLFNILVRFRLFKIALSADEAKMYQQVELDKAHRDFHRILWRFTADGPVETLRMTRVTYGVVSSSYHSIRSSPIEVQRAILRDFYVDDILTGANLIDEARILQKRLVESLKRGRFDLRKWTSNESSIILDLPPECREANYNVQFLDKDHTIKTLGTVWQHSEDRFVFKVSHIEKENFEAKVLTKTQMLSDISKSFDPLGRLSPVTKFLKQLKKGLGKQKFHGMITSLPNLQTNL